MKIKKIKVFTLSPDYYGRDSKSMDMNMNKLLLLLSFIVALSGLAPCQTILSLSAEVKKSCFLTFHAPPKLRFHEVPATADRSNLLRLGTPVSQTFEVTKDEDNATSKVEEFPLTSYGEDADVSASGKDSDGLDFLPPADPFTDYNLGDSSVDSTDQLIQLFENLEKSGNPSSRVSVNFIPPYSTDSGNFKVQSRASYTRRVRQ